MEKKRDFTVFGKWRKCGQAETCGGTRNEDAARARRGLGTAADGRVRTPQLIALLQDPQARLAPQLDPDQLASLQAAATTTLDLVASRKTSCEIDAPTFIPLIAAVATLHGLDGPTLSLSDAFALNAEAQKQTTASGIAAVAPITALSRALTAALDPDALAPIAPDFPPERAQEIARAVRNDTVAALCRALDTALRETVGGWESGAAARALHAAGAFAATLPAADAELDARRRARRLSTSSSLPSRRQQTTPS